MSGWMLAVGAASLCYAVTEAVLMRGLSRACLYIGIPLQRLSGPLRVGTTPADLATRLYGITPRSFPDGSVLIRPGSPRRGEPRADPSMVGIVGVLRASGAHWFIDVRMGIGSLLLLTVMGTTLFTSWFASVPWIAAWAIALALRVRHIRRWFRGILAASGAIA
jgi:hypothetical protein